MLYKKMYGSTIMMLATMDIMVIPITSLQQHRILKNITVAREIYELHYYYGATSVDQAREWQ